MEEVTEVGLLSWTSEWNAGMIILSRRDDNVIILSTRVEGAIPQFPLHIEAGWNSRAENIEMRTMEERRN